MREDENNPQLDLTACSESVYVMLAANVPTIDDATARQLDKNKGSGVRKSEVGDEDPTCHRTSARVRAQPWL
jgi:hypothetical protein